MNSKNKDIIKEILDNVICFHTKLMFKIAPKFTIKHYYERKTGKKIDIDNPKTYNEKIQWSKLNDHNPLYVVLADKLKVRQYIKDKIGEKYLIPLLGSWNKFDDINFNELPNQFVLKCNHDSGSVIVCKDKMKFDYKEAKRKLSKALKKNLYYCTGEWQYKDMKPCIIAEKYMIDFELNDLRDYKFLCFNGSPVSCRVDFDRFGNHTRNVYDSDWKILPWQKGKFNHPDKDIPKPSKYEEMWELARKLSDGFGQVRIDLYCVNNQIYFGEYTFTNATGIEPFIPDEYDLIIGDMWEIRK